MSANKSIFRKQRRSIVWMAPCWPLSHAESLAKPGHPGNCHLTKGRGLLTECKTCDGKMVKVEELTVTTWRRVKR